MSRDLTLSPRARDDLAEVWDYTAMHWSTVQADRYAEWLVDGLERCRRNPERGARRDEVAPGFWSWPLRRHVAYYRYDERSVHVLRVLHGAMDPDRAPFGDEE